jgi:hypothetical protein
MTFSSAQYKKVSISNTHSVNSNTDETITGQYERVKNYGKITVVSYCNNDVNITVHVSTDPDGTTSVCNTYFLGRSKSVSLPLHSEYVKVDVSSTFGQVSGTVYTTFERVSFELLHNRNNEKVCSHGISTVFSSDLCMSDDVYIFDQIVTNSAQVLHTAGFPYEILKVSNPNDRIVKQSLVYVPYTSGETMLVHISGTLMSSAMSNVRSRIGLFDDTNDKIRDTTKSGNGFYFQYLNGSVSVVCRTSVVHADPYTPVQTDTVIDRSKWNINRLDGTGRMNVDIDFHKNNTFVIEYKWYGSSCNALFGVLYDNSTVYCHSMQLDSSQTPMTGSLPIRYEIEAIDTFEGQATTIRTSSAVKTRFEQLPKIHSYGMAETKYCQRDNKKPLIAIKLRNDRLRSKLTIKDMKIMCTSSGNVIYSVYKFHNYMAYGDSGPLINAVNWLDADMLNTVPLLDVPELNVSGTCVNTDSEGVDTSGATYPCTLLDRGYFSGDIDSVHSDTVNGVCLNSDINGNTDLIVVVVEPISKNESIIASMSWYEY